MSGRGGEAEHPESLLQVVEQLRRQASVLEYIIEHVPHSIFWKDWDGRFLGGNRNLLRDVGVGSLAELAGKTDYDLGFPKEQADFFRKCDLDVMESGKALLDIEESQDQADGTHTLLTSKVPLRDRAGSVMGMLGIYVDITERKRMEEELRKARDAALAASRAKGEFLTVMSHELRTPLTLILGPLDWILTRPASDLPPDVRVDLERIRRNAGRLLTLVNDLLDFTLIEAGTMLLHWETTDVGLLVSQIVVDAQPAAARAGVDLRVFDDARLGALPLDRRKFEKITLNLVGNALKFTPAGGRVDVVVRAVGAELELSVADTGPGIPRDKQSLLFQRFSQIDATTTRKHEGTGIGLALVKELAERMGGRAGVESEPGRGSRFFVFIPRTAVAEVLAPPAATGGTAALADSARKLSEQLAPPAVAAAAGAAASARPRLLIAEDNPDMGGYLAGILGNEYAVEVVGDGKSALAAARAGLPAVIVSDVMMPEMDGLELVRELKQDPSLRQIPVLLLTAKASRAEVVAGLDAGADDYIGKPFSAEELIARVRAARRLHDAYRALDRRHAELAATHAELERTQEQLVHAAKIGAVGTLVAGLSHELNNPLSIVLMNTHGLLAQVTEPRQRRQLELIERSTKRCADLVGTLLDFSRKKPSTWEPLAVRSVLERVAEVSSTRARRSRIALAIEAEEPLPLIPACVQEIETALLNLVNNALDATSAGGSVSLGALVADRAGRTGVELRVRDTGHGISPEAWPHIFDPFFTTKPVGQGTGLGLAITRKVADDHGGTIDVESGSQGTTVRLWLPAERAGGQPS